MPQKKRVGPEPVEPVTHQGIRFEAIHWGKSRGLDQNGGYIAAIDTATDEELWLLKVYDVIYDGDMEADKQDLFIERISIDAARNYLIVEHERGGRYRVDLDSRKVEMT
ncbi:MAG: hypothetical protein ABW148_12740 [Sedimenticola sp.]